jgi:hypothetical protein
MASTIASAASPELLPLAAIAVMNAQQSSIVNVRQHVCVGSPFSQPQSEAGLGRP